MGGTILLLVEGIATEVKRLLFSCVMPVKGILHTKVTNSLLLLIVAVALFTFLANPYFGVPGCDSSIFIYVARRMMAGQVPYLDVFDQKGLLLYVLDAIGWRLGNVMGIWALDILAFSLGLWLMTRIACVEPVALSVWIVLYHLVSCGGNMPEMWIIVFSGLAYVLALKVRTDESWKWFVMGVCLAQIFMLKLNMIAVAVPIGITWLMRGATVRPVLLGLAGCVVGLLPYFAYLTLQGAWGAFCEVYIRYNAQYAARGGWVPSVSRAFYPIVALWGVNVWMALHTRRRVAWINFAYLTAAWGLVLLSGGSVRYYGPVLPACIIPLNFVVETVRTKIPCAWNACSCVVLSLSLLTLAELVVVRNRPASEVRAQYKELHAISGLIEDRKSVTALGCDCHVYQVLDAVCPGRFPFQGTISRCSETYRNVMVADLKAGMSRYLIVPRGALEDPRELGLAWAVRPIEEHYRLLAQTSHYEIFEFKSGERNLREVTL